MLVTTTWNVAGCRVVATKGEVFGLIVRSRSIVMNFGAGIRALFGGEIKIYTELLQRSREEAIERMIQAARAKGANAVLSMRFEASEISNAMTEIVAYGTAVIIEPE